MKPTHNQRKIKKFLTVNKNQFKLRLANLGFVVAIFSVIIMTVLSPFGLFHQYRHFGYSFEIS